MGDIENVLKHKIFFTQQYDDCDHYDYFGKLTGWSSDYRSNTIYNHEKIGDIYHREEFFSLLKPILFYLRSKGVDRMKHKNIYSYVSHISIRLIFKWKCKNNRYMDYKRIKIWEGKIEENCRGITYHFSPHGNITNEELSKPFDIEIQVIDKYDLEESEDESYDSPDDESENELEEDKPIIPVSKPYNSDNCVVCLLGKPELLFMNCLHRCVCLKCEETNPFHKCPTCRNNISTKVKI